MKTRYRVVAATKSYHKANWVVQKKYWWWPFWVEAEGCSYYSLGSAKKAAEWLKTNIEI